MSTFPAFAAVGVAVAAGVQAWVAFIEMRETELDVIEHWQARDELRSEIRWWRPIQRRHRSREVKQLIDGQDAPEFRRRFRRLRASVFAWILLVISSIYGVIGAWTS